MFYIFKGCGDACKGCGNGLQAACSGCGQCLKSSCTCQCCGPVCKELGECCDSVCSPIGKCCKTLTAPFKNVWNRPLGMYVYLAVLMGLPTVVCAILALVDDGITLSSDVKRFCIGDIALGLVHMIFAFYIQQRIWRGIAVEETAGNEVVDENGQKLSHAEILTRSKHIIMYDFFFLAYCFIFPFSFIWNILGLVWAKGADLPYVYLCSGLMIAFGVVAFQFVFCWFCGQCCGKGASSVSKSKRSSKATKKPEVHAQP